jgi:hypothetical protein
MYTINTETWIIIACVAILVEIALAVWIKVTRKSNFMGSRNAFVRNTANPSMISEFEQRPNRNSNFIQPD